MCVALGMSCYLAETEFENDLNHVEKLFNYMKEQFEIHIGKDNFIINGDLNSRYLGNLSVSFKGLIGNEIASKLANDVALSTGAACIVGEPSYVLRSINIDSSF